MKAQAAAPHPPGGGGAPPGAQPRRPLLAWMALVASALLAAWAVWGSRAMEPRGLLVHPASPAGNSGAPLPERFAALAGGAAGSSGSSSTSGSSDSLDSDLQTEAARDMVPRLEQRAVQAALDQTWSVERRGGAPAAGAAAGTASLRIPRILHHGESQ